MYLLLFFVVAYGQEWNGTSGYVSIDSGNSSGELFYWRFPPRQPAKDAPLLVWLQGGPGASSIEDGLLRINGPYKVDGDSLVARNISWNNEFGVVYIDSPVGTGYSIAREYATSESEIAGGLVQLLSKIAQNETIFLCGESYGGHYLPPLALAALDAGLNVKGVSIGDGLTEPYVQVLTKPSSAYHFGLIDEKTRKKAQIQADLASLLAIQGKYKEAKEKREEMERIVLKASGANAYDVRRFEPYDSSREISFLNSSQTLSKLNITKGYFGTDSQVSEKLEGDVMRSYSSDVVELLQVRNISMLFYQGQFDWKDGYASNEAWLSPLFSKGAIRTVLSTPEKLKYGWLRKSPPLYQAVVADAGHMAPMDNPVGCLDLITRFVKGTL